MTMTTVSAAAVINDMEPLMDRCMTQIENMQLLYGAIVPQMFSDLKSNMRQLIEMRNKLGEFAHDVPFGIV